MMKEKAKYLRDRIVRLLGWATAMSLLVVGYAMDDRDLFELCPDRQGIQSVRVALQELQDAIDVQGSTDIVNDLQLQLELTQLEVELNEAVKDQGDAVLRAGGLLFVSFVLYGMFLWVLAKSYAQLGADREDKTVIPRGAALAFAWVLSVTTWTLCWLISLR